MKKFFAILAIVALASCGGSENAPAEGGDTSTAAPVVVPSEGGDTTTAAGGDTTTAVAGDTTSQK